MSRIQQILDKAEREGRVRRTTSLEETPPAAAPAPAPPAPRAEASPAAPHTAAPAATPAGLHPSPRLSSAASGRARTTAAESPASAAQAAVLSAARRRPAAPAIANPVIAPARTVEAKLHTLGIAALQPHSSVAEQYRALRTRIAQSERDQYYRAILVTSPSPGDGKSITALNLALAMAQEFHRRVLLIDADLRSPSLHKLLGIPGRPGLSDVLTAAVPLEEAIVGVPNLRLAALPAGTPVDRPSELLGSGEMRRVLDALRTQFDRILLDTPPAAPLADVGVLAPLADGALLVVRAGHTGRPAIDRAIEDLGANRILGLVLNDVEYVADGYSYAAQATAVPGLDRGRRPIATAGSER